MGCCPFRQDKHLIMSTTRWHAIVGEDVQTNSLEETVKCRRARCYTFASVLVANNMGLYISSGFIMITPAFDLSQDPDHLIISIRVPYTRTSEFDLYIDGTDFKFYAKPYFLR